MSGLVCPGCQGWMTQIHSLGMLIDACTTCRGVWLDRTALAKIAILVSAQQSESAPPERAKRTRGDDDDDDDGKKRRRKASTRRKSLLDFFD